MQTRSSSAVFVDISVLMDYCTIYLEGHRYADEALDIIKENNGKIVVSHSSRRALNRRMANRQRAWEHLEKEATRYLKESDNPLTEFRAEVLNFTDIEQAIPNELDVNYLEDIDKLREELNKIGLDEFRKEINRFRIQAKNQRFILEDQLIAEDFSKGGQSVFNLRLSLSSCSSDEEQLTSMIDGVFWCQDQGGGVIIVSHENGVYQDKDNVQGEIRSTMNVKIDIYSPKFLIKSYE